MIRGIIELVDLLLLWRKKSAPELMGAELLIMFVLIVSRKWHSIVPVLVPVSNR